MCVFVSSNWGPLTVSFKQHPWSPPGRAEVLAAMPPWKGGGEMIREVWLEESNYAVPPARFEAGTPPISQAGSKIH